MNKKFKALHVGLVILLVLSLLAPIFPQTAKAEEVITVAEAIANNTGKKTVEGYIVGVAKSGTSYELAAPFTLDTNLGIADSPDETDAAKILPVQLPAGKIRNELNLKDNPEHFKKQVQITGDLAAYFSVPGLRSASAYYFVGDDYVPPVEPDLITIGEAREKNLGETVKIKGIVAANLKNTISVQDETGGIAVRPTSLPITVGDEVTLIGELADYRGLLQLDSARLVGDVTKASEPTPKEVTGAEVNEENESLLVRASNIKLTQVDTFNNYTATDGTTEFIVRDENGLLGLEVYTTYESITGIVQQFDSAYQIIPRSTLDIVNDSSILVPPSANPDSGTFIGNTTVTLSTTTADAQIFYTLDGSEPTENSILYSNPIEITADTTLKAIVKTADGEFSEVKTYNYQLVEKLEIHHIQGATHASPYDGQTVQGIEGIVTYSYVLRGANYYHIQTPDDRIDNDPKTSEAIVLYSGNKAWPITVGDFVSVTGKVSEYAIDGFDDRQQTDLKTTQINVRDDQNGKVEVLERGVKLPEPIVIDENNLPTDYIIDGTTSELQPYNYAADFWESLEAMRVQVGNVKAVAPQEHGDLITVLENRQTTTVNGGVLLQEDNQNPDRIQFRLEPNGTARDFEVATGDTFAGPITGVVSYSFQNYKIIADLDEMKAKHTKGSTKPKGTSIVKAEDKLTIASYNLENFSNNTKTTSNDKAAKLARAFVTDMNNPDIIGVTEVQDNNGPDAGDSAANKSYERLIQAIKVAGGVQYEYVNIDPVNNQDGGQPNANIRVGFLYNPERVTLTAGIPVGDAKTAVGYEDGKLTLNPGRIDPMNKAFESSRKPLAAQFDFQGESVIVIANHWNSKSGDSPLFGSIQPPVNKSEVQRHQIAQIVSNFVASVKAQNPKANIVSLGDFNDFEFSQSLKIHKGQHLTNMIEKVDESNRYTYVYQGNSQVLDHILVSNHLAPYTAVDIVHINADFTDMAGRASDHDPVIVQLQLETSNTDPAPGQEADYTAHFKNTKASTVTIAKPSVAISIDESSIIRDRLVFTGEFAKFTGKGLAAMTLEIAPKQHDAKIDFAGATVEKVVINGDKSLQIHGAENIQSIEFTNGATPVQLKLFNSKGEPIEVPLFLYAIVI